MGTSIKISDSMAEAARSEGRVMTRSLAAQLEHWAKIGRAVERSPQFDYAWVRQALAGEVAFDDLGGAERDYYLEELQAYLESIGADGGAADFIGELRAEGVPIYIEDEDGNLCEEQPDGTLKVLRRGNG